MAVLGLCFCARAFSSCGKRGPLFIAVLGPLTIAASLVAEHKLQTRRLSGCGSRAQLLRGMWDLPRLGLEPVSPALAGRFSTTAPPGRLCLQCLKLFLFCAVIHEASPFSVSGPSLLIAKWSLKNDHSLGLQQLEIQNVKILFTNLLKGCSSFSSMLSFCYLLTSSTYHPGSDFFLVFKVLKISLCI